MNIYVGNLAYSVSEDDLKALFAEFGAVESVKIITDKFSGQSKGFGFVEMPNQEEARAALAALNGSDVKGRNLKVNEARPRTGDRSGGYGGGRHGGGGRPGGGRRY
jgi:RNA recognition motif-containing protein